MKKNIQEYIKILQQAYFPQKYNPQSQYLNELSLLHTQQITGLGGEQTLNDSNTKVEVGISDFNGTLTPTDAQGLIRALTVEYGSHATETNGALIAYSPLLSTMPAWLKNSEVVVKLRGVEQSRIRVSELGVSDKPRTVVSEWAKELERTLKIEGGEDLQLYLVSPKGAVLDGALKHFVRVNLFGIKFADRKL
jgi:hypothetical protein